MSSSQRSSALSILVGAGLLGGFVGAGSIMATSDGRAVVAARATSFAIAHGMKREREPQAGDHWGGCDDARAAGTAPIYYGEPGYRPEMDGDSDGIACEPYKG